MTMDEAELRRAAKVRKQARMLAMMKRKHEVASDSMRGGRIGDDFDADDRLLKLDTYNKMRLLRLLDIAVSEYKWVEAAGIACIMLRSLPWWGKELDSRPVFTIAMAILKQLEAGEENTMIYKLLFNLMYVHQPSTKTIESKRRQGEVEFHLALYMSCSGDYDGAYNALRPVVDGVALRDDPAVNLEYGLILHKLWYDRVCEQTQSSDDASEASVGEWQPEGGNSDDKRHLEVVQANVEPQVVRGPHIVRDADDVSEADNNSDASMENNTSTGPRKRSEAIEDDEEFWSVAKVHVQPVMDKRLFPVQVPYTPGTEYKVRLDSRSQELLDKSVEHLQQAIACASEMTPALLPLVQMLLAMGDVEGANKEIEICYQATKHIGPLCMRALLLESLSERDTDRMARCYEQILQRNPSSLDAVTGLISLHENDEYETQSLIQALAVHLDTESGSVHVWRKLSDCLFEIAIKVRKEEPCDISSEDLVFVFLHRNELWRTKHFPHDRKSADESANRWKLVTYKAACAAHIYGPDFSFVERVAYVLGLLKMERSLAVLESHREQSLCLMGV